MPRGGESMWLNIIILSILGFALIIAAPATIADVVMMFRQVLGEEDTDGDKVQAVVPEKLQKSPRPGR